MQLGSRRLSTGSILAASSAVQAYGAGHRAVYLKSIKNGLGLVVPIRLRTTLPAGSYRMRVSDDQGRAKELAFTINMQEAAMEPLVFDFAK